LNESTNIFTERRKRINVFKVGESWVFKHFFSDNKELFRQLADHYNRETYRFEFKSVGERNQALKLLERNGFDAYPIEELKGYVVKLDKFSKYSSGPEELGSIHRDPKRADFLDERSCRC